MFGKYNLSRAEEKITDHIHEGRMEICYLAKGEQLFQVGSKNYEMTGGQVFVTFPNELHSTGHQPRQKSTLYWLILDVRQNTPLLNLGAPLCAQLKASLLGLKHRVFEGSAIMEKYLEDAFMAELIADEKLRVLSFQASLMSYITEVLRCSEHASHKEEKFWKKAVTEYVKENLAENIPVAQLARIANLSESRFKVVFRETFGMPPAEYIVRQRIDRAAKLLSEGKLSITEIAFELGFPSSQYFSTAFKRYRLITPSQWQTKHPNA